MDKDTNHDDLTIEPDKDTEISDNNDDLEYSEDDARDQIKKLKARIKELEKESKENLTGWQRVKADYINARKEEEKNRVDLLKYANEGMVLELLPALDAFDMAMANKEAWEKVEKNWRSGVEYIYNQIQKTLSDFGVKQENPLGEKLDIMKHNPIGTIPTEVETKKGTVAEVLQKGYVMHGREIRPASVKVYE